MVKRTDPKLDKLNLQLKVEKSLDRVRNLAIRMKESDDLKKVVSVLFDEMGKLGFELYDSNIGILDKKTMDLTYYGSGLGGVDMPAGIAIPCQPGQNPYMDAVYSDLKTRKKFNTFEFSGKALDELKDFYMTKTGFGKAPEEYFEGTLYPIHLVLSYATMKYGVLEVAGTEPLDAKKIIILKRFASVLELCYTRFYDLQKAEEQVKEAKIQMALEKVRARTMAMHKSEELREVVYEFFEQLQPLGLAKWGFQLRIAREDENGFNIWISTPAERILPDQYHIPTLDHWVLRKYWDAYKQQLDQVTIEVTGDDKLKLDLLLFEKSDVKNFSEEVKKSILAYDYVQFSVASMRYGLLEAIDVEPIPEEKFEILKRYAKVFEQTYTRFLDLKKAEAQAREAQIESALERVRSRSMAMQKSAELKDIVHKLSNEIGRLDVIFNRIFICIFDPATLGSTWWMSNPESGESFGLFIKYHEHFPYQEHIKAWRERKVAWQYILKGQDKKEWDAFLFTETDLSLLPETIRHSMRSKMQVYLSCSFNNFGYLVLESSEPLSSTQFDILSRFAKTFDQSYTRFLDIQKAEVQAREAVKQASLDRVRGEIASMRTSEDLNRITPVIWHELKALEVPFFRCGVFIVDDETKKIDTYLSNPEGESLATWRSDYDTIPLFKASVKAWKKQQVYRTEWNKKQFIAFSQTLIDHGLVRDVKRFQEGEEAPNYLSLQMIPFKQGMLYVGSAEKLNNDQIELVQALASAFSIAYSRYEDFRQLEKVKNDVEHALTELRSTQTQLIHSEKMASLGELTAGIAHEIQNPLNFVNNFSEVSADLLEDMVEGILIGNMEEVKAITEDLRQNLEKINHHGKRASDIVKGMLQHSRSNSGRKEAVDINLLAEEYLRLAYHGLRAKDKSFNADFKTDLDESIPKINVSGQDLGRVFLNLINNAFYAVSEKQIKEGKDYKPIVKLTTRRMSPDGEGQGEENIRISIKDNGPGIPEIIRDKIFQPFFTTKPTGQGTGLGLSLSYDIITKGHHGSLEVVTEEGSGTEFIIILPIN